MVQRKRTEDISYFAVLSAVVAGLYLSSLYSYLLFHSLIEIAAIAISLSLFILTWNAGRFLTNNFLTILGIGYAFIGLIDLLHTLAYSGMSIFTGYGANTPTQLWIAARFLQAITLCAAPFFVERSVDRRILFAVSASSAALLIFLVFSNHFPDCYIEGKGLTPFKITSEYIITLFLLLALALLFRKRKHFTEKVFALTVSSIAFTALSELSFTFYLSVYDFANLLGHFAKLSAFYLVYRAILVTGLRDPLDLIFRELTQTQNDLRQAHDTLEEQVIERTAALRSSEEKYRALIESANDAVFIHEIMPDGKPGPFQEVNELACTRLGYTRQELIGMLPFALEDPLERAGVTHIMELMLTEGHAVFETIQISKDGRRIPVEVSSRVIEIQGTRVLFSLVRDITGRKQAEQALHRLNRELKAISNCNQALMRAVEEQSLLNEICRIICDEAGYRMAWVGFAWHDAESTVHPAAWAGSGGDAEYLAQARFTWADRERGRGPSGMAIRTGKTHFIQDFVTDPIAAPWRENALARGYRSSLALPLKDEKADTFGILNIYSTEPNAFTATEIRLLEELAGDLAFGIIVLRGRAERRAAEEALHETERKLRTLVESIPDCVARFDANARHIYVNPATTRTFGNPVGYFIGRTWSEMGSPENEEQNLVMESTIKRVFEEGLINRMESRWVTVEGIRFFDILYAPERDEEGRVISVLGIAHDITERKKAQEEALTLNLELERRVKERTVQLESANKELEAFAYSVSHDLRAPLRHIDGFLELLRRKNEAGFDEQSQHYMNTILNSTRQMSALIDDLLAFSRMARSELRKTQVELETLVRDVIRELEPEMQDRTVNWHIAGLPAVYGDRSMLQVVLANLLSNALKFTRKRPIAEIEIGPIPSAERETILFVRDNGVGFDMTYSNRLFGVFQRLHTAEEFEGTGIGLANVRRVIDRHGGRTWAESKPGEGATFFFSLPEKEES